MLRASSKICKGIDVFENTKIEKFNIDQGTSAYTNEGFKIQAKKIIVAINSWMPELKIKQNFSMPLILTSSITRPLTLKERLALGNPKPWGVLSVKPTGATLRYTYDYRIMIRNTSEPHFEHNFNYKKCIEKHKRAY